MNRNFLWGGLLIVVASGLAMVFASQQPAGAPKYIFACDFDSPEWMDVYQGGKKPAKSDDHLYIDNVVIARNYIGPLK